MRAQMQQVTWDCSHAVVALFHGLTEQEKTEAFRRVYDLVLAAVQEYERLRQYERKRLAGGG